MRPYIVISMQCYIQETVLASDELVAIWGIDVVIHVYTDVTISVSKPHGKRVRVRVRV